MLLSILGVKELPDSTDATDAVAVAVLPPPRPRAGDARRRSRKGMASFVRNNPDRLR